MARHTGSFNINENFQKIDHFDVPDFVLDDF